MGIQTLKNVQFKIDMYLSSPKVIQNILVSITLVTILCYCEVSLRKIHRWLDAAKCLCFYHRHSNAGILAEGLAVSLLLELTNIEVILKGK